MGRAPPLHESGPELQLQREQIPLEQLGALEGQGRPQPPQLTGSREKSLHWPLQHVAGDLQARPHWPQLKLSLAGSTQALPQRAKPRWQQSPCTQVWVCGHWFPQEPQLSGSLLTLEHEFRQQRAGLRQVWAPHCSWQRPAWLQK